MEKLLKSHQKKRKKNLKNCYIIQISINFASEPVAERSKMELTEQPSLSLGESQTSVLSLKTPTVRDSKSGEINGVSNLISSNAT